MSHDDESGQDDLRARAESILTERGTQIPADKQQALLKLLHELDVHKVELEIQNVELRASQAALESALARYADLYDSLPVGYATLDRHGTIVDLNLQGASMLGEERPKLRKRSFACFFDEIDRQVLRHRLRAAFASDQEEWMELSLRVREEEPIPVRLGLRRVAEKERGDWLIRAVIIDVSERVRAEREREACEKMAMSAQRLESIGVLAGGVAHDFNNILTIVMSSAELAALQAQAGEDPSVDLQHILDAAERAQRITRQLLAYAGHGSGRKRVLDLVAVVESLSAFLRSSAVKTSLLDVRLPDEALLVRADQSQMEQVIVNLVTNAAESIADAGGQVTLSLSEERLDEESLRKLHFGADSRPGSYALLKITDTGEGMEPGVLNKVFEPFFTSKFDGRGLGLSVVAGCLKNHEGGLAIESEPGQGTVFSVYLRLDELAKTEDLDLVGAGTTDWRGTGRILLVDDEEGVVRVTGKYLEHMGFEPIGTVHASEARELAATHAEDLRAAILDLTMPEVSGQELFEEFRRTTPHLPVLFFSGHLRASIEDWLSEQQGVGFLEKPFSMATLRAALKKLLES